MNVENMQASIFKIVKYITINKITLREIKNINIRTAFAAIGLAT